MSLQYITDDKGQTTGVFIPIQEWNSIKSRYNDIDQDIPDWVNASLSVSDKK